MFEILPIFVAATPNQEHQSRLLVAKMVAKDFRPTNFLRGKRLKIIVKILSLRISSTDISYFTLTQRLQATIAVGIQIIFDAPGDRDTQRAANDDNYPTVGGSYRSFRATGHLPPSLQPTPFRRSGTSRPPPTGTTHAGLTQRGGGEVPGGVRCRAQKKVRPFDLTLKRRLPTLPRDNRSTIGVSELNFSVRNGKRWNLTAITT